MSHKINIPRTFKALRKLPLIVSYEQVERWVLQTPPPVNKPYKFSWLSWLKHWLFR